MKILEREDFLLEPKYTVFAKTDLVNGPIQGNICVKMGNFGKKDFYYTDINSFTGNDLSESVCKHMTMMHENMDLEFPGRLHADRDGQFEQDMKFIVYDRHEIQQIVKLLNKVLSKMDKRSSNIKED